jgi:hypothetical protein
MSRRIVTAAAVAGLSVAVLAGCSGGSSSFRPATSIPKGQPPATQVKTAFTNLGAGNTVTGTLKLGLTGSQLLQFVKATGSGSSLTSQQANQIAGLSLVFTTHSTSGSLEQAAGKPNTTQSDFTVRENGSPLAEARVVNGSVYLQARLQQILSMVGQPAAVYQNLKAESSQLPPFVGALVAGKWISLKIADLKSLEQEVSGAMGGASASPNASQRAAIVGDLQQLYSNDITVKQTSGSGNGGTYTLTGNTRKLATDFLSDISDVEPALQSQLGQFQPSQVPNRSLTFDATVTSGKVSQLSFDVVQLAPPSAKVPSGSKFPIDLDLDTTARSVTAPSGASAVSLSQLSGLLSQLGGGLGGSSSNS